MKIDLTVGIVIAVIVVLAAAGLWLANPVGVSPTATTTPQGTNTDTKTPTTGGVKTPPKTTTTPTAPAKVYASGILSINDLLKMDNATYSCSFTSTSQTAYRTGTFVMSGKKWRGDFTNKVSMIDDGKFIYVWTPGEPKGLQVVATSGVAGNAIVMNGGIDAYTPLNYKCNLWTADTSKFAPPSGVTFLNSEGYPYTN